MADTLPYRNKATGKVQDLTADQVGLFPGQYDRLGKEPKNDLGEDEGSTPISHDDSSATAAPVTTGD